MTKKKTKTPQKSAQQVKRQAVLQRLARGRATRTANLAAKKAQAVTLLASLPPSAQKAAGKMATKKRNAASTAPKAKATAKKGTKRAKKGTVTDNLRSRAATLANAIRGGRVAVRQGVKSPKDAAGQTNRAKYQKFMAVYKGVRIPKKAKGAMPKTPSYVYKLIPGQQSRQKFPYYLAAGYTSRVGGGATGPGVVRVIPKTGATPFRSLDESKQREIVSFLNGDAGKALRGKGAKRKVTFQAIKQVIKAVRTGPGTAKKKQKASANYR